MSYGAKYIQALVSINAAFKVIEKSHPDSGNPWFPPINILIGEQIIFNWPSPCLTALILPTWRVIWMQGTNLHLCKRRRQSITLGRCKPGRFRVSVTTIITSSAGGHDRSPGIRSEKWPEALKEVSYTVYLFESNLSWLERNPPIITAIIAAVHARCSFTLSALVLGRAAKVKITTGNGTVDCRI